MLMTMIVCFSAAAQLTADEEFTGPALQETIDAAYKQTSKKLLEILYTKYQFRDHLKVIQILYQVLMYYNVNS